MSLYFIDDILSLVKVICNVSVVPVSYILPGIFYILAENKFKDLGNSNSIK